MIFEAIAGTILIAIAFLLMGLFSRHEYLKVFYLVVALILTSLGSSILFNEGSAYTTGSTLLPLVLIGTWGLSFIIFLLMVKLIIDIFASKIIPFIKMKQGIHL
jgi:hypothetical protein